MAYTEAQELAAKVAGCEWPGLLHHDLIKTIARAESRARWGAGKHEGPVLDAAAMAVLVTCWELVNPDARMIGD